MPVLNGLDTTIELTRHALALKEQGYDFVVRYYSNNASKSLSCTRHCTSPTKGSLVPGRRLRVRAVLR